ncbi:hypothetical protein HKD37_20G055939 [Glycine soja]
MGARYDRSRFVSQNAYDCYVDNALGQKILPKRNVKLYITEFDEFRREIERRNWHKELTNFSEGSINVALVKEFYANLYDLEDKSPKQVRVRGHLIKFDDDALNTFMKTPVVIEEGDSLLSYSRFCRLRPDPQELATRLCIPRRGFKLNADGLPLKILRKNLTTLVQTWTPTSHTLDITLDRAKLIYGLVTQMNINLGSLISDQISLIAQHDSLRLGFPALITALCKARGVTSDSLTFESLSPAINLAYIKKNCWNLDDPSEAANLGLEDWRHHLLQLLLHQLLLPLLSLQHQQLYFSGSFLSELRAILFYAAEPASGLAFDHAELEEFGPPVMVRPGVQPSTLGEGEASAAQEPQQEDILEVAERTSPEPFTLVFDPVVAGLAVSPQPEPSAPVPDLPLSKGPSSTLALDLNEHAHDH